jgi:ParB family chromosome partitioning protein
MTQLTKKKLTSLDEMFGGTSTEVSNNENQKTNTMNIDLMAPSKNHPFKPYTGKRFDAMVRSIRELGVLQPLILRSVPGEKICEILAGCNRWRAARQAGLMEVPVIRLENVSDDEAMLIITETNFNQRSFTDLTHSERAFVLSQHYDAIKSQGKRLDIINEVKNLLNTDEIRDDSTSRPLGEKLNSDDKTGLEFDLSARNVSRYLRINKLITEIKKRVDDYSISIRAGVELSYLTEDNQIYLNDILNNHKIKIDEKLATDLHVMEKKGKLNEKSIMQLITGTCIKPKKEVSIYKGIKLKSNVVKKYFSEKQSAKEVEDIIDQALDMYFGANKKEE